MLLLSSLCFANYELEGFKGIGVEVNVPPPMWLNADGSGGGVKYNEIKSPGFVLYEFVPDTESWENFTMTYGITVADITGYKGTFKDLVGEYAQTMENICNQSPTMMVPTTSKNAAIFISACGEVRSGVKPVLNNKGDILVVYMERKGDRFITVYSEYVVRPFTSIFVKQWPVGNQEISEAIKRLRAVKIEVQGRR